MMLGYLHAGMVATSAVTWQWTPRLVKAPDSRPRV